MDVVVLRKYVNITLDCGTCTVTISERFSLSQNLVFEPEPSLICEGNFTKWLRRFTNTIRVCVAFIAV